MAALPSKWSPNALPSKVASSAKLLATASRSRRFAASNALPTSSSKSAVVDSSGMTLVSIAQDDYAASEIARAREGGARASYSPKVAGSNPAPRY
jgi:hypothetical protein